MKECHIFRGFTPPTYYQGVSTPATPHDLRPLVTAGGDERERERERERDESLNTSLTCSSYDNLPADLLPQKCQCWPRHSADAADEYYL